MVKAVCYSKSSEELDKGSSSTATNAKDTISHTETNSDWGSDFLTILVEIFIVKVCWLLQ